MTFFGLAGLLVVSFVRAVPGMAVRSVGVGFRKKFRIGGRDIVRPKRFNTKAHKAAFENLGRYITNALTRDVMISYQDDKLTDKNAILIPRNVPLTVWHEVLAFFVEQGCIERYWTLRIPSRLNERSYSYVPPGQREAWDPYAAINLRIPSHGPHGEPLQHNKVSAIAGVIRDANNYSPGMLTDEQKRDLLGKPYKLYPDSYRVWNNEDVTETVVVEDRNFTPIHYRSRSVFSQEDLEHGAELFVKVMGAASKK